VLSSEPISDSVDWETSILEDQVMMGTRRSGAPFVGLLLVLASMTLASERRDGIIRDSGRMTGMRDA